VTTSSVVDIDAANRQATLIANLNQASALPGESFDCIILTEVLHLLTSPDTCLRSCHEALREEGTLLITVPALKRLNQRTRARTTSATRQPASSSCSAAAGLGPSPSPGTATCAPAWPSWRATSARKLAPRS
jgi:SAM-dependent methyltransferase